MLHILFLVETLLSFVKTSFANFEYLHLQERNNYNNAQPPVYCSNQTFKAWNVTKGKFPGVSVTFHDIQAFCRSNHQQIVGAISAMASN